MLEISTVLDLRQKLAFKIHPKSIKILMPADSSLNLNKKNVKNLSDCALKFMVVVDRTNMINDISS